VLTLARWLGPWADSTRAPTVAVRDEHVAGIRVRVYGDSGTPYLIAPGLHYAGPDDPRMDRFCRILAAAGHHVAAPFIPGYLALTPGADAIADFIRVADAIAFTDKPVVFSISFGSLLAFALAAERPEMIERLVIFGGYSDFHTTMRYCLTGEGRDPLNQPVVLMNLLELIAPHVAGDLRTWWREYVTRTWGRPEMKARDRFTAVAEALAPDVPEAARELFLIGIGVTPGAWDLADAALARFDASALDPAPYLAGVHCRVDLVHGTDDDVIPYTQSLALAAQLAHTDVRVHVTGMYGHTGAQRPPLSAAVKELVTMVRVLRAMS
jgi:pimeloyl-ACP methyl ester carboxylesterase